jgi:diguanylate cyclase
MLEGRNKQLGCRMSACFLRACPALVPRPPQRLNLMGNTGNISKIKMKASVTTPPAIQGTLAYEEGPEQAAEYLRLALAFLGSHQLAPNPVNFALCYDYVAGRNAALKEALDQALAGGQFCSATAHELYRRFIWDDNKRQLEAIRNGLRTLVMETISGVDQAKSQAEQSSDSLAAKSAHLERGPSLEEMRRILGEVVGETRGIARNSQLLKEMLDETRQDVEALRDELEHTRLQVSIDALTGLKNRRAFDAALQESCSQANKPTIALSLLLIDIDHFKDVNDTYGHLIGDKVIRSVGALLSANIKGKDTVARIGGEEFAVLLPETPLANAERVGEVLRAAVERSRLTRADTGETVGRVTVSIGIAAYQPGESSEDFMERADKALYLSKKAGRNRVSVLAANAAAVQRT